jgi:hypothetical protein
MKTCWTINGQVYCVKVSVELPPWLPPIEYGKRDPTPWLESDTVSRETVLDLSALASIESLVSELRNPKLKKQLAIALKDLLGAFELPAEVNVHFDERLG